MVYCKKIHGLLAATSHDSRNVNDDGGWKKVQSYKSFSSRPHHGNDVLKGKVNGVQGSKKSCTVVRSKKKKIVIEKEDYIDVANLQLSVLAMVRDVNSIHNMFVILKHNGFDRVDIRYVGGLWVWIKFENSEARHSFMNSYDVMNQTFVEFREASLDFSPKERLVWIDIVGSPLVTWNPKAFKKIGATWGDCVSVEMDEDKSLAHGKVCILTKLRSKIQEEVIMEVDGSNCEVYVSEIAYWSPNFVKEQNNAYSVLSSEKVESQRLFDDEFVDKELNE